MRLKYFVFFVFLLNLSAVFGANSISLDLEKKSYSPFSEIKGMCLLKLDSSLDLGLDPKIKISIGDRREERNALDVLTGLDPRLDVQRSSVNLVNSATQKTLDLNEKDYFGIKLTKGSEITMLDFDIMGVNNNGFPSSPFIDFKDDGNYEWYYPGNFNGWKNDFVKANGLSETRASEDIVVRDNLFLYCGMINLPYSNKFNVSASYTVEDNSGNISMLIFDFDEELNLGFNKQGECSLKNIQGSWESSCVINTNSFLNGNNLVCFYNSENDGSYLLAIDDSGENSFQCDSELLDGEEQCSYLEEGDFFIKAFKPNFQGEFNLQNKFSDFGVDFKDELTDHLSECEDDENGDCNIILTTGSQNNKGKLKISNVNIEYLKPSGTSFITRRIYDVEYKGAKILGINGEDFRNYSLSIPLEIFDNLTVPNITTNISKKIVKLSLGNLDDQEDIEVNKNIISSAENDIESIKLKLEALKDEDKLSDFFTADGVNLDQIISTVEEFKISLDSVNNNPVFGISEKSEEAEKINEQVNNYIKEFPKKATVEEDVSYPRIYPENIKAEILGTNNQWEVLESQEDVSIDTRVKLVSVETFDGKKYVKTFIKRTLTSSLNDYFVFEDISSDVVQSADDVKFSSGASIVNDAVVKWHFNGDGEISYIINGNILGKLDKITTIAVPSYFEDVKEKAVEESFCGDNICTNILEDELICPEDCKIKYNINWALVVILIIILVFGIVYFNFFMGKRKLSSVLTKKYPFISSEDENNLRSFILKELEKKVPRVTIYKILLQKKWTKEQIDYIFKKVQISDNKAEFIFGFFKKKK